MRFKNRNNRPRLPDIHDMLAGTIVWSALLVMLLWHQYVEADAMHDYQDCYDEYNVDCMLALFADEVTIEGIPVSREYLWEGYSEAFERRDRVKISEHHETSPEGVLAGFLWHHEGELKEGHLVLLLNDEGKIKGMRYGYEGRIPFFAEGGQLADAGMTWAGIAGGAVEANPAMAGVVNAGGGPALVMLKLSGPVAAKYLAQYETCVEVRKHFALMGYATVPVNGAVIGGAALAPPAAIGLFIGSAAGSYWLFGEKAESSAEQDCFYRSERDYIIVEERELFENDLFLENFSST